MLIFLGIVGGIIIFYLNTTYLETLTVKGNRNHTRAEVLNHVGFNDTSTLWHIMTHRVYSIENKGYIDEIKVTYHDLRNVTIEVTEKEVIAYAKYMGKYLCIDAGGYIIDYTTTINQEKPKIKGVEINQFTLEEPFDVERQVLSAIGTIYRLSMTFDISIDWIDFKYSGGDEIVLVHNLKEIYLGDITRIEEKFEAMKEIFSVIPEYEPGVLHLEELDGNIIFQSTLERETDEETLPQEQQENGEEQSENEQGDNGQ